MTLPQKIFGFLSKKPILSISLTAFLIYFQSLLFGFVYIDDNEIISDRFDQIKNPESIFDAFDHDAFFRNDMTLYRPILGMSFIIDAQIGGKKPFIYHFTNVCLHVIVSILVFILFTDLNYKRKTAMAAGLFFAVSSAGINAVNWIVARDGMMALMFCLISFINYIRYQNGRSWKNYLVSLVSLALAVFSKEIALVFPAVQAAYSIFKINDKSKFKDILLFLPFWTAIIILFFVLREHAMKPGLETEIVFGMDAYLKNLAFIPEAVFKMIVPVFHSVLPSYKDLPTAGGIIVIIIMAVLIFSRKDINRSMILFGIVWFVVIAFPGMFIRYPKADFYFDYVNNRMYALVPGLIIVLFGLFGGRKFNIGSKRASVYIISLLLIYAGLNIFHSRDYKDAESFWDNAIKNTPEKPMMHYRYGYSLWRYNLDRINEGEELDHFKFDDIIKHFEISLKLYKDHEDSRFVYKNLIDLQRQLKRYDDAFITAQKALLFLETYPQWQDYLYGSITALAKDFVDMSVISFNQNDLESAIDYTQKSLKLYPQNSIALTNLGMYYDNAGKTKRAVDLWHKAASINPHDMDPVNHLLTYFIKQRNYDSSRYYAIEFMRRGGKLKQDFLEFLNLSYNLK